MWWMVLFKYRTVCFLHGPMYFFHLGWLVSEWFKLVPVLFACTLYSAIVISYKASLLLFSVHWIQPEVQELHGEDEVQNSFFVVSWLMTILVQFLAQMPYLLSECEIWDIIEQLVYFLVLFWNGAHAHADINYRYSFLSASYASLHLFCVGGLTDSGLGWWWMIDSKFQMTCRHSVHVSGVVAVVHGFHYHHHVHHPSFPHWHRNLFHKSFPHWTAGTKLSTQDCFWTYCTHCFSLFVFIIIFSFGSCGRLCGSATGKALDLQSVSRRLKSYSRQRCVTTLGKLFTLMLVCASVTKQYNFVPAKGQWCCAAGEVTAGLAESNGSLPPGGWLTVTCGMTACTPVSAPGPTLGIEYGKPLPFFR